MHVLFLQRQPCIRALKYAVALRARAPHVTLSFAYQGETLTAMYGRGDDLFKRFRRLPARDPGQALGEVIADERPDLIHSHNLPDELSALALRVAPSVPLVHDAHDLHCLRHTPYEDGLGSSPMPDAMERRAIEGCAGLVVVSEEMLDALAARYRLPEHVCTYANYALADEMPPLVEGESGGDGAQVVYQGTLSTNGGHYDLRDSLRAAARQAIAVDVMPNRPAPDYRALGPEITLLDRRPAAEVIAATARYRLGWAIFNPALNGPHLDTVLPNKLYEYLGAGLAVVSGAHRALAREIDRLGVGIVVADAADLGAALAEADIDAMRARARAARLELTVEANIDRILDLYSVVSGRSSAPPEPVSSGRSES